LAEYSINYLNSMISPNIEMFEDFKITEQNVKDQPELLNYIPYNAFDNNQYIFMSDILEQHKDEVIKLMKNIGNHILETNQPTKQTKYILNKHLSFFKYGNSTVKTFVITQIINFINTPYSSLPFLSNYGSRIKERLQTKNTAQNEHIIKSSISTFVSELDAIYSDVMWVELSVKDVQVVSHIENNIDTNLVIIIELSIEDNDGIISTIGMTVWWMFI